MDEHNPNEMLSLQTSGLDLVQTKRDTLAYMSLSRYDINGFYDESIVRKLMEQMILLRHKDYEDNYWSFGDYRRPKIYFAPTLYFT